MQTQRPIADTNAAVTFGRRKVAPRVCVVDSKPHIRNFLQEALQGLGFISCECEHAADLSAMVMERHPDLIVLGLSAGGIEANEMLETLARLRFGGKVLLFGPRASLMVIAIHNVGEEIGLAMLPLLPTPFCDNDLRERVAALLPIEAPPNPPVGFKFLPGY